MDKSVHLFRDANSSRLKTEDVIKLVRPGDLIRAQIPVPTTYVGQALGLRQLGLTIPELLLRLFAILDIGIRAIPPDDASLIITEGYTSVQIPTISPVYGPVAFFLFVGRSSLD